MDKFIITIRKTLSIDVTVEAENEDIALGIVEGMYRNEEVVLDADDFIEASFHVYKKEEI